MKILSTGVYTGQYGYDATPQYKTKLVPYEQS